MLLWRKFEYDCLKEEEEKYIAHKTNIDVSKYSTISYT